MQLFVTFMKYHQIHWNNYQIAIFLKIFNRFVTF